MSSDVHGNESYNKRGGQKSSEKLSLYTNVSNAASLGSGELKTAGIRDRNSMGPKLSEKPFTSLYERTMTLLSKLYSIPDFEFYLFPEGIDALVSGDTAPVIDPIAILWHCFRLGAPLCHLFNQLRPAKLLPVPDVSHLTSYTNICKKGIFHFLIAVKEELGLDDDQVFTISELYNDDMNKLVKVLNIVDYVLDRIEEKGYMPRAKSLPFSTSLTNLEASDNRSKSIAELLATERKFVESMQELMTYQEELRKNSVISNDLLHQLFANLGELLDFQRRFLFSLEATLALPWEEQHIGAIFLQYEEGFSVYDAMCANYNSAIKVALENQEILTGAGSIDPKSLQSYLIKPVQRICRYPMILNEIIKLSNRKTYPHYDELLEAAKAVGRVTERVNEVQRAEENRKIKKELITRINSQKVNHMGWGDLLLYDKFSMSVQDSEQLYHVYLFDNLVLCCKETVVEDKRKSKDLLAVPPLEVKGKIFVTSITQIVDKIDVTNGVFSLQVFWNSGQHSFLLKCRNVEQVNLWKNRMLATAERSSAKHENPEMSAFSPPVSGNQKQIEVTIGSPVQARRPSTGRNQAEFPSGRRSSQSGMEPRPASGSNYGAPMSAGLFAHPSQMYPPSVTAGAMPSPRMAHNGPPKAALPMPPTRGSDSPSSIRTGPPRSARPNTPDLGRNRPPNSPLPTPPRSAAAVQPIDLKAPPPASPLPEPPKSAVERSSSRNSPPTTRPSTFGYEGRRSAGTRPSGSLIKLKTRYRDEIFILAIPAQGCPFEEILDKIERKIRICGAEMPQGRRIKLRYRDEDDDLVTINTDEDIDMAFELAKKSSERGTVNLIAD